ncbi:MAG TPA: twin-arginine translocase TatA/TatE family subunit [Clostridia bacterium]|nr:twin-arginine translocase TatA/TatE family subunit [Clostridia bacterium]
MPIGAPELIIILVIALLILGPGKLPEVGSSLGKTIREFRKASTDIQDSVKIDTSPIPPSQATQAAPPPAPVAPVTPVTPAATDTVEPPAAAGTPDDAPASEPVSSGTASSADPATRAD